MRIAAKLNIGVLAVFAASVFTNYLVLQTTIKPKFDDIEMAAAHKNHDRVLDAIATLSASLRASAQDYAFWDSCYDFAQGKDGATFVESTLTPSDKMLENVSVDAAVFMDLSRKVLWAAGIDNSSAGSMEGLVADLIALKYHHPYLTGAGKLEVASGVIMTSKGLAIAAVAPIVKGDHTGAPVGTVVMTKLIDVSNIQEVTGVHFDIQHLAQGQGSPDGVSAATLSQAVEIKSVVPDITGQPLALLTASTPRDLSQAGASAIKSAILLMMAAAGVVIMALWLFVKWVVVSRVSALKTHIGQAVASGRISQTRNETADDEIGDLARSFNDMAGQVNNMRDALVDSAYLSGLSEWASGTLHNVRNALTPINMYALKIQDLFDDRWRTNVKMAIAQVGAPDTAPERREKLVHYLVASSQRMLESAEQTTKLTDRIIVTSKAIEDIVGEYERFGRKETEVEPVEVGALVEAVAKTVIESHGAEVKLTLPGKSAFVKSNRTILRQILANLLVNAVEAMHAKEGEKLIRIEIHTAGLDGRDLELWICDNGEGISPEDLKSIFERGFSTRGHKKGGLGLHWCANAAKAMGGSLRAQSNGSGEGAKLVLRLPNMNYEPALVEAA